MTNGEILRGAAAYIEARGWYQGGFGPQGGPRCVAGAIRSVTGTLKEGLVNLAAERVDACTPRCNGRRCNQHEFGCVGDWNDRPERTKEQVVATLLGLAFDEDLKAAATADNPAHGVMATPNPVEQTHDSTPETGALVSQPQLVEA